MDLGMLELDSRSRGFCCLHMHILVTLDSTKLLTNTLKIVISSP